MKKEEYVKKLNALEEGMRQEKEATYAEYGAKKNKIKKDRKP